MELAAADARTVLIDAPIRFVWDELADLDRLLCYLDVDHTVAVDGRSATATSAATLGPYRFDLMLRVRVSERREPSTLDVQVDVPQLHLVHHAQFRLAAEDDHTTTLRYAAQVECRHRRLVRRRQEARSRLRAHVIDLTDRIARYCADDPVVRKDRERAMAAATSALSPQPTQTINPIAPVPAQRMASPEDEAYWRDAAEVQLHARLRRLVDDSDADERRTAVWAAVDKIARSLRYPVAGSPG